MRSLALASILVFLPGLAYAQDAAVEKKDAEVKVDGKVTVKTVVSEVKDVIQKAKDLKKGEDAEGNKIPKLILICALLAAIFKVLLSILKVVSKWFKSEKGKLVLKLSTLVLGFGTFLVTHLTMDMSWYEALWLSLSGPGALVIQALRHHFLY